ncbi:MAG TPA: TetR/AcrR family transcriptional regulator [Acidimicrobiales bacterium]|nr:TetR/AcrR family transcriptional regulator [Acidimicrobiales bacterium]
MVPAKARRRAATEDEKAERREELLGAAKEVFANKGFHATTMADVARAGGASYGSVYWYFASKEALFDELMDTEAQALRRHILATVRAAPPGEVTGALEAAVRATFEFFEADRATVKLLFRDSYAMGARFEKHLFTIYEGFIADLEQLLVRGQEQGEIVDAPAHVVAFSVAALVGQLAHRRLTTDDGLSAAVVAQFVVNLLLDGLRPRTGT